MSTPAPVAAEPSTLDRDHRSWCPLVGLKGGVEGRGEGCGGVQLAGKKKAAGICLGSAGASALRGLQPFISSLAALPRICRVERHLNQSWHGQCPWVDWRGGYSRCVSMCVCVGVRLLWQSGGDERHFVYDKQKAPLSQLASWSESRELICKQEKNSSFIL